MDENLIKYLDHHGIRYVNYEHPAVFTVAQSKKIKMHIPGLHTKCLFLKDDHEIFYLVVLPAEKRLDMKILKKHFNLKELYFGSSQELKKELNLTPGSVSVFGMIYSHSVHLIIDKELWDADTIGFHPNINTSTLVVDHENLEKFYKSLKGKKKILEL